MKTPSLEELVLLPEPLALQRHFDSKNYRVFRWLWIVVCLACVGGLGDSIERYRPVRLAFFILGIAVSLGLFALRRTPLFEKHFRQVLIAYLALQLVLLKAAGAPVDQDTVPLLVMFMILLSFFRFRLTEHLVLFGAAWVTGLLPPGWLGITADVARPGQGGNEPVMWTVLAPIFLAFATLLTWLEKRRFLEVWRREHARSRERLRMREEIEYARKIQLSMLPQAPPDISWVELAGASLPATEVGGDYYEYFRLSPSQLAVVIGDVAGHGLASGLLLSGVRSCLYLMEKELAAPAEVLERLNPMVRRTTDRRTYITLLCALLDREAGTLTLANAGHLPLLHFRNGGDGRCEEVGDGAPPLGTFLRVRYGQVERPIAPGDLLVLYTDGLSEARNAQGLEYGMDRVQQVVARVAKAGLPAREIRDAVLNDFARFRGDSEQVDDITLVVARLK